RQNRGGVAVLDATARKYFAEGLDPLAFDSSRQHQSTYLSTNLHNRLTVRSPAIHLVFEPLHGRPGIRPRQPGMGGAAAHDLVGEKRIEGVDRVDLSGGGVGPTQTERRQAAFHL